MSFRFRRLAGPAIAGPHLFKNHDYTVRSLQVFVDVVVYGVTGNSGSEIVKELLRRGHMVTGVARKVDSLRDVRGVTVKIDDLSNADARAATIAGAGAVMSEHAPPFRLGTKELASDARG